MKNLKKKLFTLFVAVVTALTTLSGGMTAVPATVFADELNEQADVIEITNDATTNENTTDPDSSQILETSDAATDSSIAVANQSTNTTENATDVFDINVVDSVNTVDGHTAGSVDIADVNSVEEIDDGSLDVYSNMQLQDVGQDVSVQIMEEESMEKTDDPLLNLYGGYIEGYPYETGNALSMKMSDKSSVTFYYTLDGTEPTETNFFSKGKNKTVYIQGENLRKFANDDKVTVKVAAIQAGKSLSDVVTKEINLLPEGAVGTKNKVFKKYLLKSLGKSDEDVSYLITKEEAGSIKELKFSEEDGKILGFDGIQALTNLESIDGSNNPDASSFLMNIMRSVDKGSMKKLSRIDFSSTGLKSLSADTMETLKSMPAMKELDLSGNQLTGTFSMDGTSTDPAASTVWEKIDFSDNNLSGFQINKESTIYDPASLPKIDLKQNRIYLDDATGDWVNGVVATGIDHFDMSDQKDFNTLIAVYVRDYEKISLVEGADTINIGDIAEESVKIKCQGYFPDGVLKGMITCADGSEVEVKAVSPASDISADDNMMTSIPLEPGDNNLPLKLTFLNGDTRTYQIKAVRYEMPDTSGEESAGVRDIRIQKQVISQLNAGKYKNAPVDVKTYVITKEDMTSVKTLDITNVSDLSGLEYATDLITLTGSTTYEGILDVSMMTKLTTLSIEGGFTGVQGLGNCSKIATLSLNGKFTELEGVEKLTALKGVIKLYGNLETAKNIDVSGAASAGTIWLNAPEDGTLPKGAKGLVIKNIGANQKLDFSSVKDSATVLTLRPVAETTEIRLPSGEEMGSQLKTVAIQVTRPTKDHEYVIDFNNCLAQTVNMMADSGMADGIDDRSYVSVPVFRLKGICNAETLNVGGYNQIYDESFSAQKLTNITADQYKGVDYFGLPEAEQAPNITIIDMKGATALSDDDGTGIPKKLEKYKNLTNLRLHDLNVDTISNVDLTKTGLQTIYLDSMGPLKEIDADLLPDTLKALNLFWTHPDGFTGNWGRKENLTSVTIFNAGLEEFPAEFVRSLTNLHNLSVDYNSYEEIPENAFENSTKLDSVKLGCYLKLIEVEGKWQENPDTETGRAIAKLREVSPGVNVEYTYTAPSFCRLKDIVSDDCSSIDVEPLSSTDIAFVVDDSADKVTFTPRTIVSDTKITVEGRDYASGEPITVKLQDEEPSFEITCSNPYRGRSTSEYSVTYKVSVIRGGYIENFVAEEGRVYSSEVTFLHAAYTNGTVSMANGFYFHTAEIRFKDGVYEVRFTVPYEVTPEIKGCESLGVIDGIATYRYYTDTLDEEHLITSYIIPMGGVYRDLKVKVNLSKIRDITASAGVVRALLNQAVGSAEAVIAKVEETRNIYTSNSYSAMLKALEAAKKVAAMSKPTQKACDEAANELNTAITVTNNPELTGLVIDTSKLADKTSLEEALSDAKALEKGKHTDSNWETLQEAIADAQAVYDDLYATDKEAAAAAKALKNAVKSFNSSGEASALNPAVLEDGVYTVYVDMINAANPSQKSMSDGAVTKPVTLTVKDGEYTITTNFHGLYITLAGQSFFGYLKELSYQDGTDEAGKAIYKPVTVDTTYDVVDEYNDADGDGKADFAYPHQMTFPLVNKNLGDDEDGFVHVQVFVPIMEAIAAGSGTQQALMKIDWSSLTEGAPVTDEDINLENATIMNLSNKTYTGKTIKQVPVVVVNDKVLKAGVDYEVTYANNINVGTATVTITGKGAYTGTAKATFKINAAKQTATVKAKTKTVKASKLKKKAQTVKGAITIKKVKGKKQVTYTKVKKGSSKNLTINKKTGKITVKKGTKKGTYKIKVKVKVADKNKNYKTVTKTVTVKVKVK